MRELVVHFCPPPGTGRTPCCGKPPFELRGDRITLHRSLVTCGHRLQERPPVALG
jgi:hypothetical protein